MTDKVRIRLEDHLILEPVGRGMIVYSSTGTNNIQEDVATHTYSKAVYEDEKVFIEYMRQVFKSDYFD